jgi:hypothetical protein
MQKDRRAWQTRSRRELSREDAREIAENISGFFSVLNDWSAGSAKAHYEGIKAFVSLAGEPRDVCFLAGSG